MLDILLVPLIVLAHLTVYVRSSLRIALRKPKQSEPSTPHSERAYRAFEFFFTITTAIVGGIGYLRISVMENEASLPKQVILAREAMTGLAALQYLSCCFLVIAVTAHLGSKFERWKRGVVNGADLNEWWRWVEPWMMILACMVSTVIWVVARTW